MLVFLPDNSGKYNRRRIKTVLFVRHMSFGNIKGAVASADFMKISGGDSSFYRGLPKTLQKPWEYAETTRHKI